MNHKKHRPGKSGAVDISFIIITIIVGFVLFDFFQIMILAGDHPAHLCTAQNLFRDESMRVPYPAQTLSYPLYHFMVKTFTVVTSGNYNLAGAIVLTFSSIFTILITRYILVCFFQHTTVFDIILIDMISVCSIFFETLKSPLTEGRYYALQCSANPWHNPTIIFVRQFGLITFLAFVKLFERVRDGQNYRKELYAFSVASVLSSLAKPSYTIVLIPAAGILVFLYWMKDIKGQFLMAAKMLLAVIPTIIIILFQFLYSGTEAGISVTVAFGSFSGFSLNDVIGVSLAAFPVPIVALLVCNRKEMFQDGYVRLSYAALLFGWMEMFFLTNGSSGDFSWGYDLSVGLATVIASGYAVKKYSKKWQMYLVLAIFFLQVVSGFRYFYLVKAQGGIYWF